MDNSILWDRLAGSLQLYVENYFISKSANPPFKLQPSYDVDYEISKDIIDGMEQSANDENIFDIWYLKIAGCEDINNLPDYLQKLIVQFLPRFFKQYPEYENVDCLKINKI